MSDGRIQPGSVSEMRNWSPRLAWLLTLTFLTPWISAAGQPRPLTDPGSWWDEALPGAGPRTGVTKHLTSRRLSRVRSHLFVIKSLPWHAELLQIIYESKKNYCTKKEDVKKVSCHWQSKLRQVKFCTKKEELKKVLCHWQSKLRQVKFCLNVKFIQLLCWCFLYQ